jgi:chemotaxis regulatin CheY-phosphate phosphatase CheZ
MKPMNLDELVKECFDLLAKVLEEAYLQCQATPGDLREAFVYRHARNISQLGQDVLCLESRGQTDSCPIIVRAMLESLFKMVAATKEENASVGIVLAEVKEEIARINQWIRVVGDEAVDLKDTVQELSSFAQRLRVQYCVHSSKTWNVFECAKVADLDGIYRQYYFLFSKHSHATASGIIAQEYQVVRGLVLQAVVFVVLSAVADLVQVVKTRTPQQHIDEAAKLLAVATDVFEANKAI